MKQRPAVMVALDAAQIDRDLGLELTCDRLVEIMTQQDVFRRDGGVGFQLEHPVPIALATLQQCVAGRDDPSLQHGLVRTCGPRGSGVKFPGARFDVHDAQYCLQDRPDAN